MYINSANLILQINNRSTIIQKKFYNKFCKKFIDTLILVIFIVSDNVVIAFWLQEENIKLIKQIYVYIMALRVI